MSLHPAFRQYLDELSQLLASQPKVAATAQSARAALAGLAKFAAAPVHVAQVYDASVSYLSGSSTVQVPVRIYVPRPGEPSDVVLFVHGGGHMAGDLDTYDCTARQVAAAASMVTVSVDYRRSPESPFPAGLTDTYQVLSQLPELLEGEATTGRVHAVADSGGAAKLASIAMRTAAGEWTSPIERQVLIYPSLDYTLSSDSIQKFGNGYFLEAERIEWYFDNYFANHEDRRECSPLFGPISGQMPQTLVIAAQFDPLIDEATKYVSRLQAAGNRAELLIAPGMIHAYLFFETLVPDEVGRTYRAIGNFLTKGAADW